jgi:hypothetical protein
VELQTTGRSAGIDRLAYGHKRDAVRLQFIEQHDQVLETAPEAIQLPDDQRIDLAALGIGDEPIELRPAVLGAADAIDVFDGASAARLNAGTKLEQGVSRDGAGPRNLVCGLEDSLCRAFGNQIAGGPPGLDVASALLDAMLMEGCAHIAELAEP